tara:strand:+ start:649 stop:798 length:150 start_codon:yes stop_codon:yes gene_type:complete
MEERYDIQHQRNEQGVVEWIVIDTGNRNMPTGDVFPTREKALAKAIRMG